MPMSNHRGTSRAYIIRRLRDEGMPDLADAIERRRISSYAVAIAIGWQKRPKPTGRGSPNESKRRAVRLRALGL
jgi:hypothetical protein